METLLEIIDFKFIAINMNYIIYRGAAVLRFIYRYSKK